MMIKERKLVENVGWLFVLQAVNIILPFVTVPYVTRVFGADRYGVFSIALNWVTYFQLVVQYGFDLSATKKVVETKTAQERSALVSSVVAARMLLVTLCALITVGIGLAGAATGEQLACMAVLFTMLVGTALQLNWLFQGLQDMRFITIATAVARSISVALIFLIVHDSSQLVLYSFLYSITWIVSGALTHIFAWRRYGIRLGHTSIRAVMAEMRDGTPIFLSSAAGNIISNVGVTVLGACQPTAVVGAYAAVLKIPQVANLMFTPVSQALYPRVNEERLRSRESAVRLVAKVGVPVTCVFAVGLLLMVTIRDPLVRILFGEEYAFGADALIPLAMWVLLGIVDNFVGVQLLLPFGHQRLYSALMVADCTLSVILSVAFGPVWGAVGAAWAIALSEGVLTIGLIVSLMVTLKRGGNGMCMRKESDNA